MSGSTPSPYRCGLRSATRRPTNGCATSNCRGTALWCGARCAASRWRSTCRSPPISASRSAWSRRPATKPGAVAIVLEHRDPGLSLPLLSRRRRHRHRCRMAVVGARARHAAPGRRSRRPLARAVRPHRRRARRLPHQATPAAFGDQDAAAINFPAGASPAARSSAPPCIATSARSSRATEAAI